MVVPSSPLTLDAGDAGPKGKLLIILSHATPPGYPGYINSNAKKKTFFFLNHTLHVSSNIHIKIALKTTSAYKSHEEYKCVATGFIFSY